MQSHFSTQGMAVAPIIWLAKARCPCCAKVEAQ